MIDLKFDEQHPKQIASIKVVGIGGAGGNTVNSIIESGVKDIEFMVVNTDAQALELSKAPVRVQIGVKSTKGLGTGANPELGRRSAEEDLDKILDEIGDADIVFLTAGMGGGTGSGALPVIAQALREKNILTIAIITKPFQFEGKRRMSVAQEAAQAARQSVDTLIVIPNQNLLHVADQNVSMIDAFAMINDVLTQSVKGISNIITRPGHMNVDFADVRAIMKDRGIAVMGTGRATGQDRAFDAAMQAISSPLLENMSIEGAHGVLLNITGGKNLGLHEISQAASIIYEQAHEDANIILGSVIDDSMEDEISVTIIATGFERKEKQVVANDNNPASSQVIPPKEPVVTGSILDSFGASLKGQQEKQKAYEPEQKKATAYAYKDTHTHVVKKQEQEHTPQAAQAVQDKSVALDDLDVPTYLRKQEDHHQQ